jgi:hypothetical protein
VPAKQPKGAWTENLIIGAMAALALGMIFVTDRLGLPQKWHAAIVGTFVTFGGVGLCLPTYWRRPFFWLLMTACLALHSLAIGFLFAVVLAKTRLIGTLAWFPIAFVEGIVLLGLMIRFAKESR